MKSKISDSRAARGAPHALIRSLVRELEPYIPGEQPKIKGLIKLNTNENPFPPSPKVFRAVRAAVDGRLRLYPNPTAQPLREKLAQLHGCQPDNIIVGNGSDELLALATRCFVEPCSPGILPAPSRTGILPVTSRTGILPVTSSPGILPAASKLSTGSQANPGIAGIPPASKQCLSSTTIQFLSPGYSLYPVLADIHGARINEVPLTAHFGLPAVADLRRGGVWDFHAALTFITTPNAPSGRGYRKTELANLCQAQSGVVVLDEAYVDFARENALSLALRFPHVLVARTFSKAYSLCFQRIGYLVGHADLIAALHKIKDSYNVNGLGQIAALATLNDLEYYQENFRRIISTRRRLTAQLSALGFAVFPSQTNFILARPPRLPAQVWLEKLRERKVLVRWFSKANIKNYLRITIGTDAEVEILLQAVKSVLSAKEK